MRTLEKLGKVWTENSKSSSKQFQSDEDVFCREKCIKIIRLIKVSIKKNMGLKCVHFWLKLSIWWRNVFCLGKMNYSAYLICFWVGICSWSNQSLRGFEKHEKEREFCYLAK